MQITFLGTGTSMGVPVIGCQCSVCTSTDPHNNRMRTSALLRYDGHTVLIDAGPDFRQQALRAGVRQIDAVLLTHAHADHIAGLDDLRPLNMASQQATPLYGTPATLNAVRERFSYAFVDTSAGSSRPVLELCPIENGQPFLVGAARILPMEIIHGTWSITGFRIGGLGYVTDASTIPETSLAALQDLDLLVLNALRMEPHPTHFSVQEAVEMVEYLRPRRALLVHMTHRLDHAATNARLPEHIQLAHDGLTVDVGPVRDAE